MNLPQRARSTRLSRVLRIAPSCLLGVAALLVGAVAPRQAVADATWTPPANPCTGVSGPYSGSCSRWIDGASTGGSAFVQGWSANANDTSPVGISVARSDGRFEGCFVAPPSAGTSTIDGLLDGTCFTQNIKYNGVHFPQGQYGISDVYVHGGTTWAVVTGQVPAVGASDITSINLLAQPGKGVDNAIYLVDKSNIAATAAAPVRLPLRNGTDGILWARASPDGNRLIWAQGAFWSWTTTPGYRVFSAPITYSLDGVASLGTITSYPAAPNWVFYETYGFSPDETGSKILFSKGLKEIYLMNADLTGQPVLFSGGGREQATNEFAFFLDPTHILYATTTGGGHGGLDYYAQQVNAGTVTAVGWPSRLTGFNVSEYANVGGWAFEPATGPTSGQATHQLLFGVCHGPTTTGVRSSCEQSDIYRASVTVH
jgi:hypothetical protein